MDKNGTWQRKQQWLERVMSSQLSSATKVFAWAIINAAYGNKTTSFPGTEAIKGLTNLSPGHYTEYRNTLVGHGAVTMSKRRAGKFKQEHCEYELNLDWEGCTTPDGKSSTPVRNSNAPNRKSSTPTGCSNTSRNTSTEDNKEEINVAAEAAWDSDVVLEDEWILQADSDSSIPLEERASPSSSIESFKGEPSASTTPNGDRAEGSSRKVHPSMFASMEEYVEAGMEIGLGKSPGVTRTKEDRRLLLQSAYRTHNWKLEQEARPKSSHRQNHLVRVTDDASEDDDW